MPKLAQAVMPAAVEQPASPGWALASLSLCMLLPSLGISIANVALPGLARHFEASFQAVQWVVLAYLLATTTLVVAAGRLGDLLGRRRLLQVGIVVFSAGSLLGAFAPALWMLVAARFVQGLGAALLMALTLAFVADTVPKARTGRAMGLLGTMSAVGTALGPSLGGVLIAAFGWPAIFVVNLPLGLLALWLARRHLPADRHAPASDRPGFDPAGTLLLALTLAAYALAMTVGRGSFGLHNLALLLAAAIGLGLFVAVEARVASPLMRLARLREPLLSASLVAGALVSTVVMATLVVGPFHLSRSLGLGTAQVGAVMSIGPLVAALTGVPAGRVVDRFGAAPAILAGLAAMAAGCAALGLVPVAWGVLGYALPIAVTTAGYALFQAANNTAVMADVAADERGVISGWLNLSRNLGLITGASLMGAVFAAATGNGNVAAASPEAVAHGMRSTFALATLLIVVAATVAVAVPAMARGSIRR